MLAFNFTAKTATVINTKVYSGEVFTFYMKILTCKCYLLFRYVLQKFQQDGLTRD